MNRYLFWAWFFGATAFYFVHGLWALGVVLHCALLFTWLASQPTDRKPRR
jgi:hypothetical protein